VTERKGRISLVNGRYDAASLCIGLGNMGCPMVDNYATGRELFVYAGASAVATTTAEATGATGLEDLAAAASGGREACASTTIRG
jgi:hypothetical protein